MSEEKDLELQSEQPEQSEWPEQTEQSEETEQPEQSEEENRLPGADLFEWLQMVMLCVVTAVILFNCFARLSVVDGHSMDPSLEHGEMMLVWGLGYQPKQGDVVVLNKTTADFLGESAIVKRVIATEGQSVDIDYVNNKVYVDGELLKEDYTLEEMYLPGNPYMQDTHFEVPEDEIFVLGDNRNNSTDSRHEWLGTVHEDYLLGHAVAAIWPISKIGLIE